MKNRKGVVIAVAILVPVLLLGGGLAIAADDAPGLPLGDCSSACAGECQTDCTLQCEQSCNGVADCTQSVTPSSELACVGIGCWDPRMEPLVAVENESSQDVPANTYDPDNDGVIADETPCVSCDVVLLNEYPEYRYRD